MGAYHYEGQRVDVSIKEASAEEVFLFVCPLVPGDPIELKKGIRACAEASYQQQA